MSIVPSYGTSTSLAVGALASLGDDCYWQSARFDFSAAQPVWLEIHLRLATSTVAGSSDGFAEVFFAGGLSSADGALAGGAGQSTQGFYAGSPSDSEGAFNMDLIGIVKMPAEDTSVVIADYDISLPPFSIPPFGSIVVHNRTGAAFSSTGATVQLLVNQVNNT